MWPRRVYIEMTFFFAVLFAVHLDGIVIFHYAMQECASVKFIFMDVHFTIAKIVHRTRKPDEKKNLICVH